MHGNTVARALWHEFPADPETAGVDRQFLWGSGLYISPVLDEGATTVRGYFPDSRFFDYHTGAEVTTRKNYTILQAPLDVIPLHVHGGNVLPTQEPAVNTVLARQNELGLIVALDDRQEAKGSFYYDAGDNFDPIKSGEYFWADIAVSSGTISYTVTNNGYLGMTSKTLGNIKIMGGDTIASSIIINGSPHTSFNVSLATRMVNIWDLRLQANIEFSLEFR